MDGKTTKELCEAMYEAFVKQRNITFHQYKFLLRKYQNVNQFKNFLVDQIDWETFILLIKRILL